MIGILFALTLQCGDMTPLPTGDLVKAIQTAPAVEQCHGANFAPKQSTLSRLRERKPNFTPRPFDQMTAQQ